MIEKKRFVNLHCVPFSDTRLIVSIANSKKLFFNRSWSISINREGIFKFPEDLLKKLDWKAGDEVDWVNEDNGTFTLTKTKNGNHLIIISDMLHNSSDYSHYQSTPDINTFKESNFHKKINVDLMKAKINILYVLRSTSANLQNNNHKNFWASVFFDLFNANKKFPDPFIVIN